MLINAIRMPGGKARNINNILTYFPPMINYKEFREPLCGGLSASLSIKNKDKTIKIQASDLNYDIYCFWNELKTNPKEIICVINNFKETIKNGKELYLSILERRKDKLTTFQRAIDFYLINRISFSGLADSGGYSQESFEKRFTKSVIQRLNHISYLISDFSFYCEDFSYLMNKGGKDVLIYCDPPYYTQTSSKLYGKNGDLHIGFDHQRFFETFNTTQHNTIITYDDCEYIRCMYKNYNIKSIELQYSMNNVNSTSCKKGKEVIITNF